MGVAVRYGCPRTIQANPASTNRAHPPVSTTCQTVHRGGKPRNHATRFRDYGAGTQGVRVVRTPVPPLHAPLFVNSFVDETAKAEL